MLIRNLIKTADEGSYAARADRNIQTGRVLIIDTTAREAILDVGMVNALGNAVYMVGVPYSPQAIPHSQDTVALLRTNSSPYSHVIGGGAAVGGANSGQVITSAGVNSIKKTGESSGQQGDITLDPGTNISIDRTGKVFTIGVDGLVIGGLQGTGVSLVQRGSIFYYYYNTGTSGNVTFTLPNLVLASGNGQAITYQFTNFSDYNVGVYANTTTYTNYIEDGLASLGIGPGEYFTFQGVQGMGSDGKWRVTNYNQRLLTANLQTGTTYTLALGDLGKAVETNNSSPVTVTVPPNASVKFPLGALVLVQQIGTGLLTIAAGVGVTLHNSGGLSAIKQYASMLLRQIAANEWIVTNDAYGLATTSQGVQTINVALNNGSSVLAVGQYVDVVAEYAFTINQNTMLLDQSGSCQLDLRKCTYSAFDDSAHPVSGDSICASAKPTVTTATKSQDTTLTGWTTSVSAGDIIRVYLVSATTATQVTLSLKVTRA
jgi:hypothetical protein